jgi:hypothetical protein
MALINCPECGAKISEFAETCNACTHKMNSEPTKNISEITPTPVSPKKGNNAAVILIVILLLTLSVAGYYYYYTHTPEYVKEHSLLPGMY